jgi:hypothetical protein
VDHSGARRVAAREVAMARLIGLVLLGFGMTSLVWLAEVSYRTSLAWNNRLAAVGMPAMLLLVVAACGVVGLGAWMTLRRR